MTRVIVWFSCGAASACVAKLASEKYGDELRVVYCDTSKDEHSDNIRFLADVQSWIGRKINIIKSAKYDSIDDVFLDTGYMSGIKGARCTVEMKKIPRFHFQQADDLNLFGYTADEDSRIEKFVSNNPELKLEWILWDRRIFKQDCLLKLVQAGIELPTMYKLGYKNNNCIGCVKATSISYWQRIRIDFPEVFEKRAKQSRELGVRLTRIGGRRIFLDELPQPEEGVTPLAAENVSCGPECQGK